MSILIKGMEMPKDGNETIIRIQPDGTVLDQYGHHLAITAVPLSPHGDLVERQAVLNTFSIHMNRTLHFVTIRDTVPTIIQAEPAPEDEMI